MKKLFTLVMLTLIAIGANAQNYRKWDFTKWSSETAQDLMTGSDWSDIEKAASSEPTELSRNNCFWEVTASGTSAGTVVTANGNEISELKGLLYVNTQSRSLAIALNYQGPLSGEGFGPYHGPSYLWLGSSKKNYFIIPSVKPGTVIRVGIESHKLTDPRGVELHLGHSTEGTKLTDPSGNDIEMPTEYVEQEWLVPLPTQVSDATNEDGTFDVLIYNTNGCHVYFIEVGNSDQKSKVAYLYSGNTSDETALGIISNIDNYNVEPIDVAATTLTNDLLIGYDAVVISQSVQTSQADALKEALPWTPVLNMDPQLYDAWGYGTSVSTGTPLALLQNSRHSLFSNTQTIEQDGIIGLDLSLNDIIGIQLGDYFADDDVPATAMAGDDIAAIHIHNIGHNGYVYLPFDNTSVSDNAKVVLTNALALVVNSKTEIKPLSSPVIKLVYKDMNTDVQITSSNEKAEIFYTLDGSEPTTASERYTGPVNVATEATIKAVAIAEGYTLSAVSEQAVDLKRQAKQPAISIAQESSKAVITLTTDEKDATIWYNYDGNSNTANSSVYTEPVTVTIPGRTVTAFVTSETLVQSEPATQAVAIDNPQVRIDVLAHMDANTEEYYEKSDKRSSSAGYFFSWGRDKGAYSYYDLESLTEEIIQTENGDSIVSNYTTLSPEEEVDFGSGWMVRSRGQLIILETLSATGNIGDTSSRNPASVDDINPYFPITKNFVNLADKNTQPSGVTFPYNAYITTSGKYAGPFDVVANIGNGAGAESHLTIVLQVSKDGNNWESTWETLGDTIEIYNGQRLYRNIVRSYEGTDEVYVRAYLSNNNSKAQFYDIYIANAGEKSQELLTGITEVQPTAKAAAGIYDLNGARRATLQRGLNIVVSTDGSVKKVLVK